MSFDNINWFTTALGNYGFGLVGVIAGGILALDPPSDAWRVRGARLGLLSMALGLVGLFLWVGWLLWTMAFPKPERFPLPKATAKEVKP